MSARIIISNLTPSKHSGGLAQLVERSLSIIPVLNAKGRVFDSCSLQSPFFVPFFA